MQSYIALALLPRIGEHNLDQTGETELGERNLQVAAIIVHEEYKERTLDNDIALLYLEEPVDLTVFTPVCLAQVITSLKYQM